MKDKPETSDHKEIYSQRSRSIITEILMLQSRLLIHRDKFNEDTENFEFVADLDRVEHMIEKINEFLSKK